MAHDDKHSSKHSIDAEDQLLASNLKNDSAVIGASIKLALETLKDSIVAESIWNHAAGVITPQDAGDKVLDFSGIGANDFTLKIPATRKFKVSDGTTDLLTIGPDHQSGVKNSQGIFGVRRNDTGSDNQGVYLINDPSPWVRSRVMFNPHDAEVGGWSGVFAWDATALRFEFIQRDDSGTLPEVNYLFLSDGLLDTSGMTGDTTLKIKAAQAFKLNDGTNDLFKFADKVMTWRHYAQAAQPALANNGEMAVWEDTDDSNRTYLIVRTNGVDRKVELSA